MLISPSASTSCDAQRTLQPFLNIIPHALDVKQKLCPKDFTRTRKLPLSKVIICTLSLVGNGNDNGVDTHVGSVFRNARRSGLWPDAEAVHRSALSKARKKVAWEVFQETLHDAVGVAYDLWPEDSQYTWHGMSVYAIDGSKYTLPATETIRNEFDSRTPNGIRQELFAAMIMTVIARTMMMLAAKACLGEHQRCQFKNAILTLAAEAALLVPQYPEQAWVIFKELLQEIARVKYYPPATPRSSQPRISKHPINKWRKRNRQTAT